MADHKSEADAALGLSPEEEYLYDTHLKNLKGKGKVKNPDGSISTLFQMTTEINGKTYSLPTVWDGKILPPDEAVKKAETVGLDKFPSYATRDEAESRYQAMHGYMEQDTGDYINSQRRAADVLYPSGAPE